MFSAFIARALAYPEESLKFRRGNRLARTVFIAHDGDCARPVDCLAITVVFLFGGGQGNACRFADDSDRKDTGYRLFVDVVCVFYGAGDLPGAGGIEFHLIVPFPERRCRTVRKYRFYRQLGFVTDEDIVSDRLCRYCYGAVYQPCRSRPHHYFFARRGVFIGNGEGDVGKVPEGVFGGLGRNGERGSSRVRNRDLRSRTPYEHIFR